jgi:hypothetical protein
MTKRDHADGRDIDARADECRFLANKRNSDHLRATSGLPPTGNIRWPMSVIVLISSGSPPALDVGGTPGECLKLTPSSHSACSRLLPEVGLQRLSMIVSI